MFLLRGTCEPPEEKVQLQSTILGSVSVTIFVGVFTFLSSVLDKFVKRVSSLVDKFVGGVKATKSVAAARVQAAIKVKKCLLNIVKCFKN